MIQQVMRYGQINSLLTLRADDEPVSPPVRVPVVGHLSSMEGRAQDKPLQMSLSQMFTIFSLQNLSLLRIERLELYRVLDADDRVENL